MAAKIWEIQHFSEALHVTSQVPTGFKICLWRENDFWEKSPVDEYVFFFSFLHRNSRSCTIPEINAFLHFTKKFKMAAKNGGKAIFVKCRHYTLQIPCGSKLSSKSLYLAPFPRLMHFLHFTQKFKMAAKNGRKAIFGKSHQGPYSRKVLAKS